MLTNTAYELDWLEDIESHLLNNGLNDLFVESAVGASKTEKAKIKAALSVPVPVPSRKCPQYVTEPRPGCFYQIQYGKGGLLETTGRAYGVQAGAERLRLAEYVNDHPYNRRFWEMGRWPFENGQISFNPKFLGTFEAQARVTETSTKVPAGSFFAIIWIPPLEHQTQVSIAGCGSASILPYWKSAARHVLDARRRLEDIRSSSNSVQLAIWKSGEEQKWFGRYSKRNLQVVLRRMSRIERLFRKPFIIECDPSMVSKKGKPIWGRARPGVRRLKLGQVWLESSDHVEKVQTFIHEMAHVAFLTTTFEGKKVGKRQAKIWAREEPVVARLNAENYGWYAISQSLFPSFRQCAAQNRKCG